MFQNLFYSSSKSNNLISFEDMQYAIKSGDIIISTLPINDQDCLIKNTLPYQQEEGIMNTLLSKYEFNKRIFIYGKNSGDETLDKKCNQMRSLGFTEIYCYRGGLFEWLLLQEIYGNEEFPIVNKSGKKIIDLYRYRGMSRFSMMLN